VTFRLGSSNHWFLLALGLILTNGLRGPVDRANRVYMSLKTQKSMITTHLHEPGKAGRTCLITPMNWGSEPTKSEVLPLLQPACRCVVIIDFCVLSDIYTGPRRPFVKIRPRASRNQ
jgi:hypothetical protein